LQSCEASERSLETTRGQLRDYENTVENLRKDIEEQKQGIADMKAVAESALKQLTECEGRR
jgi:peptidoglycan hydrolase CwlO-like protein